MPSLSLSDGESLAGRSKNSPVEKAVCDRRHIIIKKLCHRVITPLQLMIGVVGGSLAAPSINATATAEASSSGINSDTTPASTQPAATGTWTTTHTFTGNGIKKTAIFTAPGDWKILYSCAAQAVGDGTYVDGVLGVIVTGTDNTPIDVAVNATCKAGSAKTTGQTEEHQGGQVYLDINATGDWTVQVQELK